MPGGEIICNQKEEKMADEGKLQKMEVDYSATVDEKIPQCAQTAKVWFHENVIDMIKLLLWSILHVYCS